jgi:ATP-binding cassette subfamily F protein uup
MINGRPRHVISYLQDYLFEPDRIQAPVSSLSGGEKNRLMIAKLMLRPSNLLILDEPTNDLDVETLELLESLLVDYAGTVILVSHDREFVDNVVSSCVVFEGNGIISEFVGGYTDSAEWYAQDLKKSKEQGTITAKNSPNPVQAVETIPVANKNKKLSYKDNLELTELPLKIETLENKVSTIQAKMNEDGFYTQDFSYTQPVIDDLAACEQALEAAYARWDELEELQQS